VTTVTDITWQMNMLAWGVDHANRFCRRILRKA